MAIILEVTDLKTHFNTPEGIVYAVNGISYHLKEGETLAVVGESGCGKSVSMMSILGLIPIPPGKIVSGSAIYWGKDLLKMSENELTLVQRQRNRHDLPGSDDFLEPCAYGQASDHRILDYPYGDETTTSR